MPARPLRSALTWLVVLALLGGAAWFFLLREQEEAPPEYRTEALSRGTVTSTVTATGTLSAVTTVQVGSQVSGIIARLYADFNSRVQKGQLLAELDPTPFIAQVEQRRADLARAEVNARNSKVTYERQKRLSEEGLAAATEYDAAKAAYEADEAVVRQLQAALNQAETNQRYTKIASPIDGVVVDRQYDVGQTVAASFQAPTLFTIAQDLTRMQVQADVDQSDIGKIRIGLPVHFTVDAYPEQEFLGAITQIRLNATVQQNVITYPVMIEVANPGEKLRPKMTADVTIDIETVKDALRIPNAALRFRPPETAKIAGAAEGSGSAAGSAAGAPPTAGGTASAAAGVSASAQGPPASPQGPPGAGSGGPPRGGGKPGGGPRELTVYLLEAGGTLKPMKLKTGITDGRFTVVTGGDLKEGDQVVVGSPTTKVETTGRPPGMGRM
ncbi:MAG: efflux RND transporter periplasmic adaptor subunit [Acidobacteria bacterium]|jgi:HlyD family secretion protein|nr:efflux RND transporter periplasmic adaptor subunit [Acidobacteriota bacterium]